MNLCLLKHMGYLPMSSGQKLMHNMVATTSRKNVTENGLFREIASYSTFALKTFKLGHCFKETPI